MVRGRRSSVLRRIIPFLAVTSLLASALFAGLARPQSAAAETATVGWIRQVGSAAEDSAFGVSVADASIYVGEGGGDDYFLRRYDTGGNSVWTHEINDEYMEGGGAITGTYACSSGIYVALDGFILTIGDCTARLHKYESDSSLAWSGPILPGYDAVPEAIFADSSGIYPVGHTFDPVENERGVARKYDSTGALVWTKEYSPEQHYFANAVSASAGYVYVAGVAAGSGESFVSKLDADDGTELWYRLPGFAPPVIVNAVSADSGGVYVAGVAHDASETDGRQAFVRRYDSNGNNVWTREFGSSLDDSANAIFVNSSGIFVAGYTAGALPGQTSKGAVDAFVRKYDTSGNEVWTHQFGTNADDTVTSISADATGVYVAGDTEGAMPGQSNMGLRDAFVAKIVVGASPNDPPAQPNNVSPANGASSATLTPILQSSTFSDPDVGDTHAASQWQIRASEGSYSGAVYDSGVTATNLTGLAVPSGQLSYSTTYFWRVTHRDDHGAWSNWSTETSFTTAVSLPNQAPSQPTNVSPSNATANMSLTPTLQSSAFSDPDLGDTHAASQWQIRTSTGSYSSPTYDSGATASNLTTATVPSGELDYSTTYYWHVRFQDSHAVWSSYSNETSLTTVTAPSSDAWAIIVGVADYQNYYSWNGDLDYTDDDAQALCDILRPIWGESHVKLLVDAQATKAAIQNAISTWLDPLEDADDTVLIYFSGHGIQADFDQSPADESDSKDEVICPYDTSPYSWSYDIFDDELSSWLTSLESGRQVIILDSCHSGGFITKSSPLKSDSTAPGPVGGFTKDLSRTGRIVLTASEEDKSAYEDPLIELGHSVFSYYLLEGFENPEVIDFNDNNEISAQEVFAYAKPRTVSYTSVPDPAFSEGPQVPEIYDGYGAELKLFATATVTFDLNPSTLALTLDGLQYSASQLPLSQLLIQGTTHSLSVLPLIEQGLQQTRYTFVSWSDNSTSASRTIIIEGNATYTANYQTEHHLTVQSERGNPHGQGWHQNGAVAPFSVSASVDSGSGTRYLFTHWSGDSTATVNASSVVMNSPRTVTANWNLQYTLNVTVEPSEASAPSADGWYDKGSTATISMPETVTMGTGTRYLLSGWTVDGAREYGTPLNVTMNASYSVVAKYTLQYYLDVGADKGNPLGAGWYTEGTQATASIESPLGMVVRQVFDRWSGDSSDTTRVAAIFMDRPKTLTANWRTDYTQLYIILGGVAGLAAIAALAVLVFRRTR